MQEGFWWLDESQHSSGTWETASRLLKGVISLTSSKGDMALQ